MRINRQDVFITETCCQTTFWNSKTINGIWRLGSVIATSTAKRRTLFRLFFVLGWRESLNRWRLGRLLFARQHCYAIFVFGWWLSLQINLQPPSSKLNNLRLSCLCSVTSQLRRSFDSLNKWVWVLFVDGYCSVFFCFWGGESRSTGGGVVYGEPIAKS